MEDKKLLLLDAYALIFRAYYAMMRNPRMTTTGIDASAVFGFVNILQDLLKRERPTHLAVCFDPVGKTFRHEQYPQYKANREKTPEGILTAVPYIKRILQAYHIPVFQVEGYEADDVIGTLAHQAAEKGIFTYMVTSDKDFGQLVAPNVKIYNPGKNEVLGVDEVKAKYGLQSPLQVIDLLGLMGDTADNIPGCPGVGPKTAEKLIQQFGSVENLLQHTHELKGALQQRVMENAEQIRFSKYLATIKTDVPITLDDEALRRVPADLEALRAVFGELEFRTLTERVIDRREANVGLDDTGSGSAVAPQSGAKPAVAAPATAQLSLFEMDDAAQATSPAPTRKNIDSQGHDYRLIADFDEAEAYVSTLLGQQRVGLCLVSDGDEAMTATMVGLALAAGENRAAYLPLDDMGWMMNVLKPLFTARACLVCNDVKRLMVMLHARGIDFTAPYYDTAVAHYLLQPERGHTTAEIAADVLAYDAMPADALIGPRGRAQLKWHQLAPARVAQWACEQAHLTLQLPDVLDARLADEKMTHLLTDIEQPLVAVLARMEIAGARIDVKALADYSKALTAQAATLEQECWQLAGQQFNTASPMQVGEILFEKLKIDDKAKKTKSGQYSTTEEILMRLRDRHPLVDKILELRGIRKLLSTYVNALPQLINPRTGRLHTTYNQTVTATGRLSSANPNLQNIPVRNDEGREIRRAFIPAEGNVFFSADYSQIELRLVADLSHDQTMLTAFAHDEDIHAITAARIYHQPLEAVTPDQRRKAKTANFGILYGISAFGLAERLNIPRAEAKQLIDGYFATFPMVRQYIDRSVQQAREKGYVTTLDGRRRMLPDINSRNAVVRAFSERNAVNAPIQGTAADIIKRAMIAIDRRFHELHLASKMILQVHDELNFDVIPAELPTVRQIVIEEMERAYQGGVRLTVGHGTGANWLDAH